MTSYEKSNVTSIPIVKLYLSCFYLVKFVKIACSSFKHLVRLLFD